jgi:hypothetical protein
MNDRLFQPVSKVYTFGGCKTHYVRGSLLVIPSEPNESEATRDQREAICLGSFMKSASLEAGNYRLEACATKKTVRSLYGFSGTGFQPVILVIRISS